MFNVEKFSEQNPKITSSQQNEEQSAAKSMDERRETIHEIQLQKELEELRLKRIEKGMEDTKLQKEIEEMKLQRQREEREAERYMLEHTTKLKLAQASQTKEFDVFKNFPAVPQFQENSVDLYFLNFEKIAGTLQWPKQYWTILLQKALVGRA